VWPEVLQLKFAPVSRGIEREQVPALSKALRKIREQLGRNFAHPPLRFYHPGDGDERAL
jgi:hypothetical protein